jgi:hypothetical protein
MINYINIDLPHKELMSLFILDNTHFSSLRSLPWIPIVDDPNNQSKALKRNVINDKEPWIVDVMVN